MKICKRCTYEGCTNLDKIKCAMSEISYHYQDGGDIKGMIRTFRTEENELIFKVIDQIREDLERLFSDENRENE